MLLLRFLVFCIIYYLFDGVYKCLRQLHMLKVLSLRKHPIRSLLSRLALLLSLPPLSSHLTCSLPLCQLALRIESNQLFWLLNGIIGVNINLARVVLKDIIELIVLL